MVEQRRAAGMDAGTIIIVDAYSHSREGLGASVLDGVVVWGGGACAGGEAGSGVGRRTGLGGLGGR